MTIDTQPSDPPDGAPNRSLAVRRLGVVGYGAGVVLQEELVRLRRADGIPDTLLLLEHEHVITLGSGAHESNVLASGESLRRQGIEVHESGRGGDVTYHGPGQLVGYPILRLEDGRRDLHRYLRDLEDALIVTLRTFGLEGYREDGMTGVWVDGAKIAAIGVRVSSGWITSHGFALNVTTDLSYFETIVPCGIHEHGVCSMADLLERDVSVAEVADVAVEAIARVFDRRPEPHSAGSGVGSKASSVGAGGRKSR